MNLKLEFLREQRKILVLIPLSISSCARHKKKSPQDEVSKTSSKTGQTENESHDDIEDMHALESDAENSSGESRSDGETPKTADVEAQKQMSGTSNDPVNGMGGSNTGEAASGLTLQDLGPDPLGPISGPLSEDQYKTLEQIITVLAPQFVFHPDETFFPSSVEFFFAGTSLDSANHYVTKEALGCANCTNPAFLKGQDLSTLPPTYAITFQKENGIIDIAYFLFFPYNLGKKVCIGKEGLFLGIFDDAKDLLVDTGKAIGKGAKTSAGACFGVEKRFGNHVGDWEHISIRLENGVPTKMFLGSHGSGQTVNWSDLKEQSRGSQVYVALGSHGMYLSPETHVYKKLPTGGDLADVTAAGPILKSWLSLKIVHHSANKVYPPETSWLNFSGGWGNHEDDCEVVKKVSGSCVLNSGPTGPLFKKVVTAKELR